jgi:hypothetical protein
LGRSVLLVVSNWGSDLGAELNDLGMLKWSVGLEIGAVAVRIVGFDSAQGRRVSAVGVRPWVPWVAPPRRAACAHRAVPPRLLEAKGLRVPPERRVRHQAGRDLLVALLMWRQGGGLGGAVTA